MIYDVSLMNIECAFVLELTTQIVISSIMNMRIVTIVKTVVDVSNKIQMEINGVTRVYANDVPMGLFVSFHLEIILLH